MKNLKFKKVLLFSGLVFILGLTGCSQNKTTTPTTNSSTNNTKNIAEENTAEETNKYINQLGFDSISFNAKDLNGNDISDYAFNDSKVTMINFWGTFCGPCIEEMPVLAEVSSEYNEEDFQIIGIITDTFEGRSDNIDKAKSLVAENGVQFANVIPNKDFVSNYLDGKIQAVPTTIFVDQDGNLIGQIQVGSLSEEKLREIIDELLLSV
ncbi:Thiol-disulfide isomerase or thioredoxin [Anaerosphaera aminiphila DSM 21120]|uniref:Thiol-disulfide isomerase or thioredoxin n=1 Tax=Anaerosphaera aminiphila DSM 21120 TaxID=1120995 RepID=A0A1M5R2Q7_9FIRM|nr:TlpA disulfide reductase family protein [Anaerosphaera aminiphila]SHH20481.1 Thiol-disulfide isomerase or thioredoxin [Anaerosphaera aminiphila DSM 21120]